jgi:type VI secretion system protein ImpA
LTAARNAIPGQIAAIKPLLEKTRDLRLLAMLARLSILNRDLGGFATALAATAECCNRYWASVHPRMPPSGDLDIRVGALATLDLPTVVFPLQYAPLIEVPRLGAITYRGWLIATGETKARGGEQKHSPDAITAAIATADSTALARTQRQVSVIKTSLDRIFNAFLSQGTSVGLENLRSLVDRMVAFISPASPDVGEVAGAPAGSAPASPDAAGVPPAATAQGSVQSLAQAKRTLGAIAAYYARSEPSSPALPLVSQAHQLIGKSFFEVMSVLVPNHIEKAAFQVGGDQMFELPVGRTSKAMGESSAGPPEEAADGDAGHPMKIETRSQALSLLEEVQRYFRIAEPSSPVPMLCERARALAGRDFMSILKEVLPKAALKNATGDKPGDK